MRDSRYSSLFQSSFNIFSESKTHLTCRFGMPSSVYLACKLSIAIEFAANFAVIVRVIITVA